MSSIINFTVISDDQAYHIVLPRPPHDWTMFFEILMDHLALSCMDTPLYYYDCDNKKHPILERPLDEIRILDWADKSDLSDDNTTTDSASTIYDDECRDSGIVKDDLTHINNTGDKLDDEQGVYGVYFWSTLYDTLPL